MAETEATVFVVDDDEAVRKSLRMLIKSVGLNAETYASAQEFLDAYDPARPGCLVLDVRMPRMSGLELQKRLAELRLRIPVIVVTGHGDVPIAVRTLKAGAVDFIEKPFSNQVLLERIQEALAIDAQAREVESRQADVAARLALLTPRERQVLDRIVAGQTNKQAAAELGLSCKTIEVHRAHVMEKMQVESLAELVEIVTAARAYKKSQS